MTFKLTHSPGGYGEKARVCRFNLLKVTDQGIKPVCRDLNGDQAVSLLDELKQSGIFIVKFAGFKSVNLGV